MRRWRTTIREMNVSNYRFFTSIDMVDTDEGSSVAELPIPLKAYERKTEIVVETNGVNTETVYFFAYDSLMRESIMQRDYSEAIPMGIGKVDGWRFCLAGPRRHGKSKGFYLVTRSRIDFEY